MWKVKFSQELCNPAKNKMLPTIQVTAIFSSNNLKYWFSPWLYQSLTLLVPTCRRRLKIMQCVSFFCTTLRWVLNPQEMGRYPKFINEWGSWEEYVAICGCPHRERRTERSGGDTDLWERYWLLHLCTCLFIVTAADTQNPARGCQRADGLQMIFQQSKWKWYAY